MFLPPLEVFFRFRAPTCFDGSRHTFSSGTTILKRWFKCLPTSAEAEIDCMITLHLHSKSEKHTWEFMWWLNFKCTFWAKTDLVLVSNHDVNTSTYINLQTKLNHTFTNTTTRARRQASKWRARECAPNMTNDRNEKLGSYAHFQMKLFQIPCFYPIDIVSFCKLVYASLRVGMH